MTRHENYQDYESTYEYHGNTIVEITRVHHGVTVKHDWVLFDSIEDAQEYFHDCCVDNDA